MIWPFAKRKSLTPSPRWPLSRSLFTLAETDDFTLADACEGIAIFGATGSGKSSGSGRHISQAYLQAGMGGLVLCAKTEEVETWTRYLRDAGRMDDLIVFSPDSAWRFNFLDYELHRPGPGGGIVENLVNLFSEVLQVAERQTKSGGREDEGYWRRALRQLVRNLLDLLILAQNYVLISDLYRVVISLPVSPTQVNDPDWQARSFAFQCLQKADQAAKTQARHRDFEICVDYMVHEFPSLSEKTRSIIVSTFTSMVDVFQRSPLRELFCTETNLVPEVVQAGKVIVMALPVKEFGELGQLSQVLMKYIFMRSIERRPAEADPRPVFLWVDESQLFATDYDFMFQTTARSARVCTVYLTQSLSNYYATLGAGEEGKAACDSLLGNLNTKLFHANGDAVTNEWAATMIGRSRQYFVNANNIYQADAWPQSWFGNAAGQTSAGVNEVMEFEVQPRRFTTLRKGGFAFRGLVDAIVFQGGRRYRHNGRTWLPVTFQQQF